MGRTRNYKTQNPYKLAATDRYGGPHKSFKRQGQKRGGARNVMRDFIEDLDNDWSDKDRNQEEEALHREVCGPFDDGDDE